MIVDPLFSIFGLLKADGFFFMPGKKKIFGQEGEQIALDRRVMVFVEVKTRSDDRLGTPLEAVHRHKQKRMAKAALFFSVDITSTTGMPGST
ncbi:MAG: YraN family protein [Candidatus Binatia bacterium]|nr:YraN family protein [Candidatus Binatia bacterium]